MIEFAIFVGCINGLQGCHEATRAYHQVYLIEYERSFIERNKALVEYAHKLGALVLVVNSRTISIPISTSSQFYLTQRETFGIFGIRKEF